MTERQSSLQPRATSTGIARFLSFGTRSLSTILGLTLSSYGFGGTIGPTLGGYVFDMTGNYFIALSLSVFLCGLSALLSFLIKPLSTS